MASITGLNLPSRIRGLDLPSKIRGSQKGDRPNMSELRILLLGKYASENNRVGNIILNKKLFGRKALQPDVETFSERVERRNITVISTTHLFNPQLSLQAMVKKVSELCDPEPHVIILVLQHNGFSKIQRDILPSVLNCFGDHMKKRTMILTTDDEKRIVKHKSENEFIQQISIEYEAGRLQLQHTQRSQILQKVNEIITHSGFNKTEAVSLSQEHSRSWGSEENNSRKHREDDFPDKMDLNVVLCGNDPKLKMSICKCLRGKKVNFFDERVVSEVCVKKEEKIGGRLLSVVELPALSRLSEEEVMRQTLLSVTLCHPGVHAFLFIVPVGQLTDEDKLEMEKIQNIFGSKEHFVVLFKTQLSDEGIATELVKLSPESQKLINCCGGQYCMMGLKKPENSRRILDLLDYVENMKTQPYSPQMYVKAQENRARRETEEKYEEELKKMKDEIIELQVKGQSEGTDSDTDDLECSRIVLIGRTGNGKSATGNNILGRKEFVSEVTSNSVTTVCQKRVCEVDGRSVSVVDTPGLFDTELTNDQVAEEIMKCVSLSSPGPHVFLIVLSLGRFTKEEMETLDLIKKIFGPKAAQFSIVLFTRGDDLQGVSIEDYVRESKSAGLKKLIRDCGNRFMVFNNNENQDRTQVIQLIKMIEEVKNTNQGRYFTNSMFEEAEMNIKKRMEEIMKEREREIEAQKEELRVKFERETEKLQKRLEEEKRQACEKIKKRENEFRQKEEKLRKDFEDTEKIEEMRKKTEKKTLSKEKKQEGDAYHQKIEELKREIENQRSEYEKQQREREDEDRKREEKYRHDQEKMKNEQEFIIEELKIKQEEEIKKRDLEEKRRNEEEEEERQRWEQKIKEAENERKEIQEEIKRQQREWEDEKEWQMREREEEERMRKEKHEEQLREKQEELEKMRQRFEREREEERQKMEDERQQQRREREEKEREYEETRVKMERHYEERERETKEEWERRKREDEERQEEERKGWMRKIKDLKQEQEEEKTRRERQKKERKEREEKERNEMKKQHEEKMKEMKKKHEYEARKQAEETNEQLRQIQEKNQKDHKLREELHQRQKEQNDKEIKILKEEVKRLCEKLNIQKEKEINEVKRQAKALNDLLKEQKGEKIEALQQQVEKFCESLQDQKDDKAQASQQEADKFCKNLKDKKEKHLKKLREEADEMTRKPDACVIQ